MRKNLKILKPGAFYQAFPTLHDYSISICVINLFELLSYPEMILYL